METITLPIFSRNIDGQLLCRPDLEDFASYKKGVPAQVNVEEQYTSGHYPLLIGCLS
jgi:hypothetical protein